MITCCSLSSRFITMYQFKFKRKGMAHSFHHICMSSDFQREFKIWPRQHSKVQCILGSCQAMSISMLWDANRWKSKNDGLKELLSGRQMGKYRIALSVYILPTYSWGTSLFARMSEQQWFEHLHHKDHKEGKTQISLWANVSAGIQNYAIDSSQPINKADGSHWNTVIL